MKKSLIIASLILSVLLVSCSSGDKVEDSSKEKQTTAKTNETTELIRWSFNQSSKEWEASGTPPECKDPFVFDQSPVDVSTATSVLYPGQTRGNNYKAHGGFGFDNASNNSVSVSLPYDAYLVEGSRYIEGGEIQYLLEFVSSCGIAIRFDHLLTLDESVMSIVDEKFPEARADDSRTTRVDPPVQFASNSVIASEVGFSKTNNVSFDFGVYDYRQQNEASKNAEFQSKHSQNASQAFYGVCWFSMLPGEDAEVVTSLPSRDPTAGKTSDYCK